MSMVQEDDATVSYAPQAFVESDPEMPACELESSLALLDISAPTQYLPDLKESPNSCCVISRSASKSAQAHTAAHDADSYGLHSIGKGLCGEIFGSSEADFVVKKLNPGWFLDDLWMDLLFHLSTYEAILKARFANPNLVLQVPDVYDYHPPNSPGWRQYGSLLQEQSREPGDILVTERIQPMPAESRSTLLARFCPPARKAEAEEDIRNRDCLVRVYLGRRLSTPPQQREWSGLRNFEADLSILEELSIDTKEHARSMGIAMAYMHFDAQHDARDVEFVLGTGPCNPLVTSKHVDQFQSFTSLDTVRNSRRRDVQLWLLDFNQCRKIELSEVGIGHSVRAFFDNDPYYPRAVPPDHPDYDLWETFKSAYMETAEELGHQTLAASFCAQVSAECQRRAAMIPKLPPTGEPSLKTNPIQDLNLHRRQGKGKGRNARRPAGGTATNLDELFD